MKLHRKTESSKHLVQQPNPPIIAPCNLLHLVGPTSGHAVCRALSCSCTESYTEIPPNTPSSIIGYPPHTVSSPSGSTTGRDSIHSCSNTSRNQVPSASRCYPTPALPGPDRLCLLNNMNRFFNNLADLEILTSNDPPWILAPVLGNSCSRIKKYSLSYSFASNTHTVSHSFLTLTHARV